MKQESNLPEICVLIPYFQNLPGLLKSLESVVYEPEKLSLLLVDDGSEQPLTLADLAALQLPYKINILRLAQNQGITKALNSGLTWIREKSKARYIARLDCGDTCTEERFKAQAKFLEKNPEVALVGSWCLFKSPDSRFSYTYTTPTNHAEIVKELHWRNVFIHPTVMFRQEILAETGLYPEAFPAVEDYAFFMIIASRFQTAILPQFLVTCEINPKGISIQNRRKQLQGRAAVVKAFGNNSILKAAGLLKISLLQLVPYSLILQLKQWQSKR